MGDVQHFSYRDPVRNTFILFEKPKQQNFTGKIFS